MKAIKGKSLKPTPYRQLGPVEQLHRRLLKKRDRECREYKAVKDDLDAISARISKLDAQIDAVETSLKP